MIKKISIFVLFLLVFSITGLCFAESYRTLWRGYFNIANASIDIPEHLDGRAVELAIIHKSFGIGTKGFRLYNNGTFDGDSIDLAGFIAPVYLYGIPFASHRRTGDITPMVSYFYAGFCPWGFQRGMLLDLGFGFTYYLFSFRIGYNRIKADSRIFFDVEEQGFVDWPIDWGSFYISLDLFPGFWISLKSKMNNEDSSP